MTSHPTYTMQVGVPDHDLRFPRFPMLREHEIFDLPIPPLLLQPSGGIDF